MREAIILAGGLGTRLRSLVADTPKPMAPILNRPFLTYLLDYLNEKNVTRVILSVGYLSEKIIDYFGSNYKEMEIIYSIESEPLGTGGAIKLALNHLKNQNFYVINGDTFLEFDPNIVEAEANEHGGQVLVGVFKQDISRFGTIYTYQSNSRILRLKKSESINSGTINGGVYFMNKSIIDLIKFQNIPFSFEDFLENNLIKMNLHLSICSGYFIDIGVPEDLKKFILKVSNG